MTNPIRHLHPTTSMERTGFTAHREQVTTPGITIREHFAAMAMQGILASAAFYGPVHEGQTASAARMAVDMADDLIARLKSP